MFFLIFLKKKSLNTSKCYEYLLLVFTVIISTSIGLIILEIVARFFLPDTAFHQKKFNKYGWTPRPHSSESIRIHDSDNCTRTVHIKYYEYGFKRWGDPKTDKIKLFIIGDSFTGMRCVSNGEEYYAYLEKEFKNVELFVFGKGGFGSLQEYMILDDFIDIIKPDIIIWQFTKNDYSDNYYILDKKPYGFGFRLNRPRPYLEDGKIVYRVQQGVNGIRRYFKIIDYLLGSYNSYLFSKASSDKELFSKLKKEYYESRKKYLNKIPKNYYEITANIISMAKKKAGDIPFYFFDVSKINDKEKKIWAEIGITVIYGLHEYLMSKKKEGIRIRVVDNAHWNKDGNKFAGEFLVDFFQQQGIFSQLKVKSD